MSRLITAVLTGLFVSNLARPGDAGHPRYPGNACRSAGSGARGRLDLRARARMTRWNRWPARHALVHEEMPAMPAQAAPRAVDRTASRWPGAGPQLVHEEVSGRGQAGPVNSGGGQDARQLTKAAPCWHRLPWERPQFGTHLVSKCGTYFELPR